MRTGCIGGTHVMALPALLLLTGCFGIPAATDPAAVVAPANVIAAGACSESGADAKDPKAREAVCLKELGKYASRKGSVLSLKLDDGTAKTFRTEIAGCNTEVLDKKCEEYRLVGFYPLPGAYLVLSQGFEIYDFKTVNIHTGEMKEFDGVPRLAPDNATFFVKRCNDGCTISINSMSSAAPASWQTSTPDADADWEFVRWIDNDQVALRIAGKSKRCPQGNCEAVLKRASNSWTIESATPKG